MDAYQGWQTQLERQPVKFLSRELNQYLAGSRTALASFLATDPDNVVIIPNATYGVNIVARSLSFEPGDEILTSNHEYGACEKIFTFISQNTGAKVIKIPIPLPAPPNGEMVDLIWSGVTSRTKLIFLSHITSPTGLRLPIEDICRRARSRGILTLIDGAHTPGHIDLDITSIGADFYTGNCHKWFMAPKGTGFLHTHPQSQSLIEPLIVSWGWNADGPFQVGSPYLNNFQWLGTKDYSAYLSIPSAIKFQNQHNWGSVRKECQDLLQRSLVGISELTSKPSIYTPENIPPVQMGIAELPSLKDPHVLKTELYNRYKIEIPIIEWNQRHFVRISIQGYNSKNDVDALFNALHSLLPVHISR